MNQFILITLTVNKFLKLFWSGVAYRNWGHITGMEADPIPFFNFFEKSFNRPAYYSRKEPLVKLLQNDLSARTIATILQTFFLSGRQDFIPAATSSQRTGRLRYPGEIFVQ